VQRAEDLQPDLILLDISLPRLNGLEAARQIRKLAPKSKILFLTGDADSDVVRAAFHAGGSGYVLKTDAATELLTGMAAVLQGKQFLSLSIKDVDDLSEPRDPDFEDHSTFNLLAAWPLSKIYVCARATTPPARTCNSAASAHFGVAGGNPGLFDVRRHRELKMSLVRVLIVDDFDPWQSLVIARLGQQPHFRIIGLAADGMEAIQKAEELQPDLILLDVSLPKLNGIEAARKIRKLVPKAKILFLSASPDPDVVRAAFFAGGAGYVLKSDAAVALLPGTEAVLRGKQFVSRSLIEIDDLSKREE
jgi:DNA-binding NarL/FixJ family response regulator